MTVTRIRGATVGDRFVQSTTNPDDAFETQPGEAFGNPVTIGRVLHQGPFDPAGPVTICCNGGAFSITVGSQTQFTPGGTGFLPANSWPNRLFGNQTVRYRGVTSGTTFTTGALVCTVSDASCAQRDARTCTGTTSPSGIHYLQASNIVLPNILWGTDGELVEALSPV